MDGCHGLRRYLAKEKDQHGQDSAGNCHHGTAKTVCQAGGEGGGGQIDDVVADQDSAEHLA